LTHVATNCFSRDISTFTYPLGNYQLRLNLAGVQDLAGNSSTNTSLWLGSWQHERFAVHGLITNRVVTPTAWYVSK